MTTTADLQEGTDGIDGERKGLNDMARFNLAPSRLARYYFFECDRFLRYDATPRDRRAEEGTRRGSSTRPR